MAGERLAQPRARRPAGGRRSAGGPAGSRPRAPNGSCQTGQPSRSASATSAAHASGVVRARADDERRRARPRSSRSRRAQRPQRASAARAAAAEPARGSRAARRPGASQSSIGTITSAGPRPRARLVPRARERARHVLRRAPAGRPTPGSPRRGRQPPGEERLLREVAAVLLADQHHQRRAVHARGRQRRDGVAEPRRGVQEHERRLAAADRVPGGHADHRPLVQGQHELEVVGQPAQERDLGGARDWRRSWSARARAERRTRPRARSSRPAAD